MPGTTRRSRQIFRPAIPTLPSAETIQRALSIYGYRVEATAVWDDQTRAALEAFQLHFRPHKVDGEIDTETTAILFALLSRYRAGLLEVL